MTIMTYDYYDYYDVFKTDTQHSRLHVRNKYKNKMLESKNTDCRLSKKCTFIKLSVKEFYVSSTFDVFLSYFVQSCIFSVLCIYFLLSFVFIFTIACLHVCTSCGV